MRRSRAIPSKSTTREHWTDGTRFDSSEGREPLEFALGGGQVIVGFEKAVEGMRVGEEKSVRIEPEEAYGPRHDQLIADVPRNALPDELEPRVGMQLQGQTPEGAVTQMVVTAVDDESITVDANHPLAGQRLGFDIRLVAIK